MAERYGYNHGDFGWNELITTDPKAATAFYTGLFGWGSEVFPMPGMEYTVLVNGEEKIGGVMAFPEKKEGEGCECCDGKPRWMPYVTVDDVDATAKKVEELGGTILLPPQDIPQVGRFIIFQDPQGAGIAAITYVPCESS